MSSLNTSCHPLVSRYVELNHLVSQEIVCRTEEETMSVRVMTCQSRYWFPKQLSREMSLNTLKLPLWKQNPVVYQSKTKCLWVFLQNNKKKNKRSSSTCCVIKQNLIWVQAHPCAVWFYGPCRASWVSRCCRYLACRLKPGCGDRWEAHISTDAPHRLQNANMAAVSSTPCLPYHGLRNMATPIDKQTAALHVSLEFTGNSLFLFREQQVRHLAVIYANTPFPHHAIFHSQNSQREWGFFSSKWKRMAQVWESCITLAVTEMRSSIQTMRTDCREG